MAGNTLGRIFKVTSWGESHGRAVGAIVDGCPAGIKLAENDLQKELDRRRPGKSLLETERSEPDNVEILSGTMNSKTTGGPICALVWNEDVDSAPYEKNKYLARPGHADISQFIKYGEGYDYRGGGRSSGRITISHVIGGAIAKKVLSPHKVDIIGHVVEMGGIKAKYLDIKHIKANAIKDPLNCADPDASQEMQDAILGAKEEGDSLGGIIEIIALNVPAGLGSPVFARLDADLAGALMGISAVKGVEIGKGFDSAKLRGSEMNDELSIEDGKIKYLSNHAGGILGGISTGGPIVAKIAVKPTASIGKKQRTIDFKQMKDAEITVEGRHDPCIAPRAVPVAESVLAIVLCDHLLLSRAESLR